MFEYAARGKPVTDAEKKRRAVFIQRATEAEEDDNRRRIVVKEVLAEVTAVKEGNDRGKCRRGAAMMHTLNTLCRTGGCLQSHHFAHSDELFGRRGSTAPGAGV